MQCGRQKLSNCWWLRPCTREGLVRFRSVFVRQSPNQAKPGQARPDQTRPHLTRPTTPDQARTRPDQAKPHQTKHGKVRHQSAFRYARTHTHTQSSRAHVSCFHQVAPSFSFFGSMSRWCAGVLTASASVDVDQFAGKRWRALQVPPAAEAADDLDR